MFQFQALGHLFSDLAANRLGKPKVCSTISFQNFKCCAMTQCVGSQWALAKIALGFVQLNVQCSGMLGNF
jgi:hypothetical protein